MMDELKQRLVEDVADEAAAAALLPLVQELAEWTAPRPSPTATEQLLSQLAAELPPPLPPWWQQRLIWGWWLLRAQLRVVNREIWAGSALVMGLGVLVTLSLNRGGVPFALIAPLVTAVGATFLFGPTTGLSIEVEWTTAVSPRIILLARLVLLFAANLILGLGGSLILSLLRSDISLWPLVATWLAPMTFLAALAFACSVIFLDPLVGVLLSLLLWSLQVGHWVVPEPLYPAAIPDFFASQAQPWLWGLSFLLLSLATWLAGYSERVVRGV